MVEESKKVKPRCSTKVLNTAMNELFDYLLEQETCRLVQGIGSELRSGKLDAFIEDEPEDEHGIIDVPGLDIFGQSLYKKPNFECECPKCKRTLAAARFAPHLEKCMGMGRNSSRIASRRLAASSHSNNHSNANSNSGDAPSNSKSSTAAQAAASAAGASGSHVNGDIISEDEHYEEDEDDEEWTMEKKKKKRNPDKTAPKKKWALSRIKNSEGRGKKSAASSYNSSPASGFSDQGIEDELEDPLALTH